MATVNTSNAIGALALELDGKIAGTVRSLQLPGYQVEQVVVATGPGGAARLGAHIGISALEASWVLSQADALTDWALSLPRATQGQARDGAALVLDLNQTLQRRVEWTEGLITELKLPTLDARSKDLAELAIQWLPGTVSYAKAPGGQKVALPAATKTRKAPLASSFRVQGLPFDGSGISRVQLPTVKAKLTETPPGQTRLPARGYAQVDLGELRLEFSARTREAVLAWVQKVIANGQIADSEYLGLSIELLDVALKKVLVTVQLAGCALLSYEESRLDGNQDQLATVALRFAVGKLDLKFA